MDFDSLVVGGGFHGCMIASHLASLRQRVLLVEKEDDLLPRPGFVTPAHQLLSVTPGPPTCLSDSIRWFEEFGDCFVAWVPVFYGIGRASSKLTPGLFDRQCRDLGVPVEIAPETARRLFDSTLIEAVFQVDEPLLHPGLLRERMHDRLDEAGVSVMRQTYAAEVVGQADGSLQVYLDTGETEQLVQARQVFHCAYSNLNPLLHRSGLDALDLRYEIVETVQVDVPASLRCFGTRLLAGPSYSLMPMPPTMGHAFVQYRHLPYASWADLGPLGPTPEEVLSRIDRGSHFERMRRDALRYMPCLDELRYQGSYFDIRTLPARASEASYPGRLHTHVGLRNLHCVLGTRLDAIYPLLEQVGALMQSGRCRAA